MPGRLALSLGTLAAAALLAGSAHAATFRYSLDVDIDYVDPALAYYQPTWEILYATCSMLVSYPDAPAPRGTRLVPDGAAAMPSVSRDGKTYTFQVRRGRRFSTGVTITAGHYAWALNRVLDRRMRSPGQPFFKDIVGALDVAIGSTRTARGIRVLPGNRLRIRLVRRAPDFLARLAMPFACPLPLSTPLNPDGIEAPVVGSGPYYIARWQPRREIWLRRNRYYRGPRTHRVDDVVYGIGLPPATIRLQIERGDVDHGPVPAAAHAELGATYGARRSSPGRYFVNPRTTIRYLTMNHERDLFGKQGGGPGAELGNVPLKRAVNFAIDRTAILVQRGAYAGSVTDQVLPPMMPGFRNAAVYPPRPDLGRARSLAAGNTRRGEGNFYACSTAGCHNTAQIVQANLREIGVDMDIRLFPRCFRCDRGHERRGEPFDMSIEGRTMDFFDPLDFIFLLDGRTIRATENTNLSYFNSTVFNRKIARASSMSGAARFRAFGALDVKFTRNAVPIAALAHDNERRFFSARVRNFFEHPVYGLDLPAIAVE